MNPFTKRYLTAFAATAVLALGLYGCGGGGVDGPMMPAPEPMPEDVDLSDVTAGFMAMAGMFTVTAGQSQNHGDIAFSCAVGGADCSVTVEVATDGTVSATSTGGMVTAMNSDAYNVRFTPVAVDLASVTAGFMAGAGTVTIMAGQSADHGDIAFSCAAGGADCQVMVTVDANGAITATSTGGMVTAMNSDAYDDRIATMHPVVGKWAGDWPGGARTVLTITSVSTDGQVTGTYRHQERGGQPFVLEISPDGPVTASLQNGVLSFSYGQSTFKFTQTAEDTFGFTFQFDPSAQMVSIDVDRQDADGMMPTDVPSAEALANVIDLVANDSRQDSFENYVGGWWWRSHGIGAQQAVVTGTYSGGQWANPIVSHDDNGQIQHNVAVIQQNALQQADPWARAGRYINTYEAPENLEGVTRSTSRLSDHELESEGWQVTELNADYENAGHLSILVATDVRPEDGSKGPYEGFTTEADKNIELPGAPALPSDQDFLVVWIPNGDTIEGSLAGIAGTFSCANAEGCVFVDDRTPGDYYARDAGITFTPNGGTAQPVTPSTPKTVPNADYLAMGHWRYVPEDVTDSVNYEFGVFASGGDPFEVAYLAPLVGTATYLGDALGMYYVDGLSDDPTIGSFTADVTLEADFGDGSETGFIDGEVYNFEYEDDVASSLPATVNLTSDPYSYLSTNFGIAEDSTNIFDTTWSGDPAPYPGGHIAAEATASADGQNWYGEWHAAFYGNGLATEDIPPSYVEHPTSVAGTFNLSTWNNNQRVDRGLAGSFGAHRYDDGSERGDPSNLVNAIDLIADIGRQDGEGNYISAWTWANWGIGAQQAVANHTYREGGHANVIVFHDENAQLQFNVAIVKNATAPVLQETPVWVQANRYHESEEIGQSLEGVTRFVRSITDHDLGPGWQVAELINDYDNGGTLEIRVVTDVEVSDMSMNPFAGSSEYDRTILLDDVPDLPAGQDYLIAWFDNGDNITGTLDSVAGSFSCSNPGGCYFIDDVQAGEAYPASDNLVFLPDDGTSAIALPVAFGESVPTADYVAFGHWLYVPEDVTNMDAYDFGIYASGGDPFEVAYIEQQTGMFTYLGDAAGVYYVNESSADPDIGSFTADVELTADFGTTTEFGTVSGEVSNFMFNGDGSSVFPTTVALTTNVYSNFVTGFGIQQGETNIFHGDNPSSTLVQPGGWIEGLTSAGTQDAPWWGRWGGKFYGHGLQSSDIPPSYVEPPSSIGGVFGLYNGDNGLAGSFGAHRQ